MLVPCYRPLERTLVWLPVMITKRLGIGRGSQVTESQWNDDELSALIHSRKQANKAGVICDDKWHRKNGYA